MNQLIDRFVCLCMRICVPVCQIHLVTDCLRKTKITEELKYLSLMRKLVRKVAVFLEFSFRFSFDYRTRIPALVTMTAVKLHGLFFQFELKIY